MRIIQMKYAANVTNILDWIENTSDHDTVFINLDNIAKLIKIIPVVYKNNPHMRTNMISKTKSYEFTNFKYKDELKKIIESLCQLSTKKIYLIVSDADEYLNIDMKGENITIINKNMYANVLSQYKTGLVIDTNEIANDVANKKKDILILKII